MRRFLIAMSILFSLNVVLRAEDSLAVYNRLKTLAGEDTAHALVIRMGDGSELVCKIRSLDTSAVKVITLDGVEARVMLRNIVSVKRLSLSVSNGGFLGDRLFFAPTGNLISPGMVYLNDVQIFFPELFIGVTDYSMVGLGVPLLFYDGVSAFYFTAKVSLFNYNSFHSAFGGTMVIGKGGALAAPFVAGTFNLERLSVTFGTMGYLPLASDIKHWLYYGGAIFRFSRRFGVMTEEWLLTGDGIFSLGFRYFGDNVGVDLGLFRTFKAEKNNLIPWLGASVKF